MASEDVHTSPMPLADKEDWADLIASTRDSTNGLMPEEKLQANSENLANLTILLARREIAAAKAAAEPKPPTSWKDVLIKCSWQFVVVVAITVPAVTALLAYRPQLAAILERLVPH